MTGSGPSLSDYLTGLSRLHERQEVIQQSHLPVLLAITFPGKPFCEPENNALKQLAASKVAQKLEIVEVRLR